MTDMNKHRQHAIVLISPIIVFILPKDKVLFGSAQMSAITLVPFKVTYVNLNTVIFCFHFFSKMDEAESIPVLMRLGIAKGYINF